MKKLCLFLSFILFIFASCLTSQHISPIDLPSDKKVCVISTPNTPAIFKDSLVRSIESKGYVVKVINYGESSVCQLDIAYQTKWHSSSKSLLTYVKIQAYKDNKIIASNAYEQRISSNSEINSVQDITRYLVNKMFTDLVTWREKHPTIKRPGYIE